MESTPVSGVDTRKAAVAPLEAPDRCNWVATGMTEQEHNGKGAPIKAPLTTGVAPSPDKCFATHLFDTFALMTPAINKPKISQGAAMERVCQRFSQKEINIENL
ncbi:hypothetical protein HVMH_2300 [Hydrogenovibrio marinus]|nr:hypothetical protein HVMH_2300 [Hydrogenovibrio marinus]